MFLVWRGWGLLAAVATFLPLACCAGLMDWNPRIAMLGASVLLLPGGFVCRYFGRKWNKDDPGFHSMYCFSLETWGVIYLAAGTAFGLLSAAALIADFVKGR